MITLYNVIDIRTGQRYSIVCIKESKAKFFIPVPEEGAGEGNE